MNYNPYQERYEALRDAVRSLENTRNRILEKIEQYETFDMDATHAAVCMAEREVGALDAEHAANGASYGRQLSQQKELKQAAAMGLDPRWWFSADRKKLAQKLSSINRSIASSAQCQEEIRKNIATKQGYIDHQKALLAYYRTFDRLQVASELRAIEIQLATEQAELAKIKPLKDHVDEQLRIPLGQRNALLEEKNSLYSDISAAESFESHLSVAAHGGARREIHLECKERFGDGSPSSVIKDKKKRLEMVERDLKKVERRLLMVSLRVLRRIKTILIDGSNLCYEGDKFIGLRAVIPAARCLAETYQVIVVFDASMRRLLQRGHQHIAMAFGDTVKVHVVATRAHADETLLNAATDDHTYVLSNDRFVEFKDKPAVQEQRILRHEILNGKILVEELQIDEMLLEGEVHI